MDEVELFIPIMNMGFKTSSKFPIRNNQKFVCLCAGPPVQFSESRKRYSADEVKL